LIGCTEGSDSVEAFNSTKGESYMNLVSTIMQMVTPMIIDKVAGAVGINSSMARTAISYALPAILGAFGSKAATPAGAKDLFSAVSSADAGLFGNLDKMLGGAGKDQLISSGGSVLNSLLGGNGVSAITNAMTQKAGIGGTAASMLVPLVGQMALSGLAKSSAGMDASGLANLLTSQAGNFKSALGETPSMPSSPPPPAPAQASSGGLIRWLIPAAAALVALWYFVGSGGQQPTTTTEQKPAEQTAPAGGIVVDGVNVGETLTKTIGDLTTTIGTMTNADTAKAALPKLEEAGKAIDGLTAVAGKMDATQKTAVGALIGTALPALKAAAEKALANAGVGDIAKPVLDGIFTKIEALAK
jgi:hypothetical protein